MKNQMKKALSVLLTLVMVFTMIPAITLVFDQKAAAANEITYELTSNGAYVYYNASGTVNKIQAPTWTEYKGQDVCPWINMTSGSWTINGQSYNYRVEIKRSDFLNEGGLYHTHIYVNDTFLHQGVQYGVLLSFGDEIRQELSVDL